LGVDGVLGPVLPDFAGAAPGWLIESGLCLRRSFPTGTLLTDVRYMRTGNVLFSRAIVPAGEDPFDPRWGRSGGEDADFFGRMLSRGRRFAWCEEARVHELVPPERQTLAYHMRRGLLRGVTETDRHPLLSVDSARSVLAILVYTGTVPVIALAKPGLAAKYAVSACDHLGKMLGRCRMPMPRERTF
jgi:succinoglycan biosynthesis protein ExoM